MGRKRAQQPERDVAAMIGATIRRLRKRRGLTLVQLAASTGLSHPFLSQVERGVAWPSVQSLARVADALGVGVAVLAFPAGQGGVSFIPHRAARPVPASEGEPHTVGRRLSNGGRVMSALEIALDGSTWTEAAEHRGEELVHLLAGSLTVEVGGEPFELHRGDTLVFDGMTPHRFRTPRPRSTRALRVLADPSPHAPRAGPGRRLGGGLR